MSLGTLVLSLNIHEVGIDVRIYSNNLFTLSQLLIKLLPTRYLNARMRGYNKNSQDRPCSQDAEPRRADTKSIQVIQNCYKNALGDA